MSTNIGTDGMHRAHDPCAGRTSSEREVDGMRVEHVLKTKTSFPTRSMNARAGLKSWTHQNEPSWNAQANCANVVATGHSEERTDSHSVEAESIVV